MVNNQQHALFAVRQVDQHRPQQRTVFQVQAALRFFSQFDQALDTVQCVGPQHVARIQRAERGLPLAALLREPETQCVVLFDQSGECRLKMGGIERLQGFEHQRLIPVLTLRDVQLEEARLNRQQRQRTADLLHHSR